ncbi:hypothetical protein RIR_jg39098.t2 [Rhizophagus irregularis DAOM 181602=DAOM 197198]|nr:hypothetical protein RIR_jg39098.t2 [Rhizophagus irregularis DAOM 181602=DAOM 197198]
MVAAINSFLPFSIVSVSLAKIGGKMKNCQKEYFSSSYFGLKFDSKYATNVSQISLIAALISVPSIISNPRQLLALN